MTVGVAVLHLGRVQFGITGPVRFSMTFHGSLQLVDRLQPHTVVPVHHDGWSHFQEDRASIEEQLRAAPQQLARRYRFPPPGDPSAFAACATSRNPAMSFITRGFQRKDREAPPDRVPPGQYATRDFPVLSAGPTPRVTLDTWQFTLVDASDGRRTWSWADLMDLPSDSVSVDIHCVTKWTKLDTTWTGVSFDTLLDEVANPGTQALFSSYGGYTTNLPVADVTSGKAWIAYEYDGEPLAPAHGGPARLLVPHLYFWKSAKWVNGVTLSDVDRPGFWESYGYHNYGDPWREQRYAGD